MYLYLYCLLVMTSCNESQSSISWGGVIFIQKEKHDKKKYILKNIRYSPSSPSTQMLFFRFFKCYSTPARPFVALNMELNSTQCFLKWKNTNINITSRSIICYSKRKREDYSHANSIRVSIEARIVKRRNATSQEGTDVPDSIRHRTVGIGCRRCDCAFCGRTSQLTWSPHHQFYSIRHRPQCNMNTYPPTGWEVTQGRISIPQGI